MLNSFRPLAYLELILYSECTRERFLKIDTTTHCFLARDKYMSWTSCYNKLLQKHQTAQKPQQAYSVDGGHARTSEHHLVQAVYIFVVFTHFVHDFS